MLVGGKGRGRVLVITRGKGFAICSDVSRGGRHVEERSKQVGCALRRWRVVAPNGSGGFTVFEHSVIIHPVAIHGYSVGMAHNRM